MSFTVKLWGVRGSIPRPEIPALLHQRIVQLIHDFAASGKSAKEFTDRLSLPLIGGYGGNTTCVEARSGDDRVIIDAGSGLRELGMTLLPTPLGRGQGEVHMFFTHFHWDHLIGLPFFVPLFIPGNRIHFYAVQQDLAKVVRQLFTRPYFPVSFEELGSKIEFHTLQPRQKLKINGFEVTPYELDHPDPCWGFRVERGGRAYAHCVDTECARQTREELGPDLPLYSSADVMLFDAQYTLTEIVDKANWGHAVAGFGLDLAMRENIKQVLFVHHDPYAAHEKIAAAEAQARIYYESRISEFKAEGKKIQPVDWSFAVEGMEIEI
ncbi:MAG: MBL fold metallo-hydrolase [Bdellovibrionales bacterium]